MIYIVRRFVVVHFERNWMPLRMNGASFFLEMITGILMMMVVVMMMVILVVFVRLVNMLVQIWMIMVERVVMTNLLILGKMRSRRSVVMISDFVVMVVVQMCR